MKKLVLSLFAIWVLCLTGFSQCTVNASANPQITCPGEMVVLWTTTDCGIQFQCDFNDYIFCPELTTSHAIGLVNPCGQGIDLVYAWWLQSGPITPRSITTSSLNLESNCSVSFYLRFGIQGNPGQCEGPDDFDEGVSLQYSTDQGLTWYDIAYFRPDGVTCPYYPNPNGYTQVLSGQITSFTQWFLASFQIPIQAQSSDTQIRWIQHQYSGISYDLWGIDNIEISCNNYSIQWEHGPTELIPSPVYPQTDSCYIIHVIDNTLGVLVSDTVCVYMVDVSVDTLWNGFVANAIGQNVSYYWVDCNNGYSFIQGQLFQDFYPQENGSYAVIVSTPNCSDTSDCYTFHHADIVDMVNKNDMLHIFPNPAVDHCWIESQLMISLLEITDVQGKLIKSVQPSSMTAEINVSEFAKGTYYIRITTEKGIFVKPLQVK